MNLLFEWDPAKAKLNTTKHRIEFTEAATVFADELSLTYPDPDHSADEQRYITFGMSTDKRYLVVAHTDRSGRIRIISAREMTRGERRYYEENR